MKIVPNYHKGMSVKEQKDLAYWERNMLALYFAVHVNRSWEAFMKYREAKGLPTEDGSPPCGWYEHNDEEYKGWSRVISLFDGRVTFHIPDDMNIGNKLPKIDKPNWDGHTSEEKWLRIMAICGIDCYPLVPVLYVEGEGYYKNEDVLFTKNPKEALIFAHDNLRIAEKIRRKLINQGYEVKLKFLNVDEI